MKLDDVAVDRSGMSSTLRATVHANALGPDGFRLECSFEGLDPDTELRAGDALLAFLLLPAMAYGETLDLGSLTVSQKLLAALDDLQNVYCAWSLGLERVRVEANPEERKPAGVGRAQFFSGGVDSWYSLLASQDEGSTPTHLFFLVGFDMAADQRRRIAAAQSVAITTADDFGARLVVSRSNLRTLTDRLIDWRLYHGSYLAATALALGEELSLCRIPSSLSPESAGTTWGSHPDLDYLWSTENLAIEQSGEQILRIDKMRRVVRNDRALKTLRVCWQSEDVYNCGHCRKCALTMAVLRVLDKLEAAETFPDELNLRALSRLDTTFPYSERRSLVLALIPLAEARNDTDLARTLRKTFRSKYVRADRYLEFARKWLSGENKPRVKMRLAPHKGITDSG